ncbi:sulfotransferase family protein [Actinospongicola halichondriae]|uniref:sulfotransferase family protein n=1 Tax=Actinospongicola halichondriae TaxID=3236844 RepID=UPI003D3CC978
MQNSSLTPDLRTIYEVVTRPSQRSTTFAPEQSPLHERMVFVVGAPRSGTTWLQQLLAVHPAIATSGESHVFCEGIQAILDNFAEPDETMMLSTWVDEGELTSLCRTFADGVFAAMRDGSRPDATHILDKTPNHRLQSAVQARLYPDATYIHIVRDGRDSAGSSHSMWKRFSNEYGSASRAAAVWGDAVRDVRTHLSGLRYVEVRYEELLDDVEGGLAALYDHIGLPHDPALVAAAAEFGRAPINVSPSSVAIGQRKRSGNPVIDRAVARVAGDVLVDLGYSTAADVDRDTRIRTRDTLTEDLTATMASASSAIPAATRDLVARYKRRRWRRQTEGVQKASRALVAAVEDGDATAVARVLAGVSSPPDLVSALGPAKGVSTKVEEHRAAITFVSESGERHLVRIVERGGAVVEAELI